MMLAMSSAKQSGLLSGILSAKKVARSAGHDFKSARLEHLVQRKVTTHLKLKVLVFAAG